VLYSRGHGAAAVGALAARERRRADARQDSDPGAREDALGPAPPREPCPRPGPGGQNAAGGRRCHRRQRAPDALPPPLAEDAGNPDARAAHAGLRAVAVHACPGALRGASYALALLFPVAPFAASTGVLIANILAKRDAEGLTFELLHNADPAAAELGATIAPEDSPASAAAFFTDRGCHGGTTARDAA